jgi:hypothetical protein
MNVVQNDDGSVSVNGKRYPAEQIQSAKLVVIALSMMTLTAKPQFLGALEVGDGILLITDLVLSLQKKED